MLVFCHLPELDSGNKVSHFWVVFFLFLNHKSDPSCDSELWNTDCQVIIKRIWKIMGQAGKKKWRFIEVTIISL